MPEAQPRLQVVVLRFFLAEAASVGDLLRRPEMQSYPRRKVRRFVHALATAGLLDHWGATSGTCYRTSRAGYLVLTVLDETLAAKRAATRELEVS